MISCCTAGAVWAQVTASITGTVRDTSGAIVPGASVTVKHLETGATRTAETDASGNYSVPSLAIGQYELSVEKSGFKQQVRSGVTLAVSQKAVVNITLEVGNVEQRVTVMAEAPLVNTTLSSTSGLVNEKEVKDLPLNGRSFDQLLTLNVGTTNHSSNYNQTGNAFSVAGKRPEQNRFLMNGVDYIGSDNSGNVILPSGASGQLLGVDAVREFNVVQHTYGAEYGKRAGGQISIVTSSGTNQLHGDAFEYLRNSALDARNFFDQNSVPAFKRNQFGGALGGPLKRDKLFLFGNYEGFRQRLGISDVAVVPDALARQGYLPPASDPLGTPVPVAGLKPGMLPFFSFWPEPNGPQLGGGLAYAYANPPQKLREDFGLIRFDYNPSAKDSFSANYTIDDGENDFPQANPNFIALTPQRNQLVGVQETHVFSPTLLNVATFGFSRAKTLSGQLPTVPIAANLSFLTGYPPGTISIGGSASGAGAAPITVANGASPVGNARNFFTGSDDAHYIKGKHSFSVGGWIQRVQQNSGGTTSATSGNVTYPTLLAFLQDLPSQFLAIPNPTPLGYRSTEAAWYVQDEIKLKPNLTLRLGLRDEITNGWNEVTGRSANYLFDANGVIETDPMVGPSSLIHNNAKSLWQPRAGLAWDPTGTGTWAVRLGFGIYNDLQDNIGGRVSADPPFNARITLTSPLLSFIPVRAGTQPPPSCNAELQAAKQPCSIFSPGGVEPNMHTPTVQDWSVTVEREITKNLMLQLGYVGSESYHLVLYGDFNMARPQSCADPQGCASGGTLGAVGHVPQGTTYMAPGGRPNPFVGSTLTYMFENLSSYHALNVSLVKRATHGLTFKANYTFSKILDLQSALNSRGATNEPPTVFNVYTLGLNKGIAVFSLKNQFNANFSYELPFGNGQHWGSGASGMLDKLIGGWQWNAIITAQSGFPFTPQVGSNRSGTGDTSNSDTPNRNPAFTGPAIPGKVSQWFDPHAFLLPIAGTFGNVSRGSMIGPGLTSLDTSLFKKFPISERWNLQFRAEAFNVLNRANFGEPNRIVFSGSNINPSAGVITSTATTSRQIQFALKLGF
jgi:hypothetical protein